MKETIRLSFREEAFNALLHGVMILFLLIAMPYIYIHTYLQDDWINVVGIQIYLLCMLAMFSFSTLYHIMPFGTDWKTVFRRLDHISILLAIAGTYTPVCLGVLGMSGIWLLIVEWMLAFFGILLKAFAKKSYPVLSMVLYLAMGWMALAFIGPLITQTTIAFLLWMAAGGVCYSIGIIFYSIHKPYYHVIWHVFIDLAFIFQFIAIVCHLT